MPIRILIVDDYELWRCGLAAFIGRHPDFDLVGEAANGREAIEQAERCRPDLVLMDLMMPVMDGVTATRVLRQRLPDVQVIALTHFVNEDLVSAVLSAGAISYLLKNVSLDGLAAAIRDAAAGKATLAREAAQALVQAAQRPQAPNYELTGRERQVLHLMIEGLNNQQIAERLRVSLSTIKKHVSSILIKLKTTSRTEAVAIAVRNKLVNKELFEQAS